MNQPAMFLMNAGLHKYYISELFCLNEFRDFVLIIIILQVL